jgi:hypothetical protein
MKIACILFHSNIFSIYKKEWVSKCVDTIVNQTYGNFDIFELNYGDDELNLKDLFKIKKTHHFFNIKMDNHADAMNYLLDLVFKEKNYDICFNINLDDFYDLTRFEKQIKVLNSGFDIVSSDYLFVREDNGFDTFSEPLGLGRHSLQTLFNLDITPLAHPCVCYSKNFWLNYGPYISQEIPREDKNLWIRSYNKGAKLNIIDEPLLFYRLHQKQVSNIN